MDDPIDMEDESALPGLGQMIYQLIEANSDLDSVRVIASKVDNHSRVKVINVVWGNRVLADAIMDRLLHGAHRLNLKGESLRKAKAQNTESVDPS